MPRKKATPEEVPVTEETEAPVEVESKAEDIDFSANDAPEILTVELDEDDAEETEVPYGEDDCAPESEIPTADMEPDEASAAEVTHEPEPQQMTQEQADRRSFFELDFHELDRDLTPEQRQEWNSIYASYRGRTVIRGKVVGVDRMRMAVFDRATGETVTQRIYCASVIPFRVRILIPETEMWMPGDERQGFVLRNMPGATIDFVIIHVDRKGGFAVGSRKLALPSRRYYFSTQPTMNSPGSRIECDVLVVGPRRCLVSCNGYDINLTQREISYTAIPDLRDVYKAGDTMPCIVKEYDHKKAKLVISAKETVPNPFDDAEFRHPPEASRYGVIAGKYAGGVFVNLPDGLSVMCNYSFHYEDSEFAIGDNVIIIIQRYNDELKQVYGRIVAKC